MCNTILTATNKELIIIAYKAKKKFGQNFLKDEFYLNKIIESMLNICDKYQSKLTIIEIGPGLGDLSEKILEYYGLISYEIDSELCSYLEDKFYTGKFNKFVVYNKDVLEIRFNRSGWLHNNPYLLISNLPYYVATKIIVNALKDSVCKGMIVMTQREVAYKFCASDNDKHFSSLSVLANSVSSDIRLIENVPPCAFSPKPKVESSIFSIIKDKFIIEENFERFLKDAFSTPRKTISNNLSNIKGIDQILDKLNIDRTLRPHQINTLQYHQIFNILKDIYGRK